MDWLKPTNFMLPMTEKNINKKYMLNLKLTLRLP